MCASLLFWQGGRPRLLATRLLKTWNCSPEKVTFWNLIRSLIQSSCMSLQIKNEPAIACWHSLSAIPVSDSASKLCFTGIWKLINYTTSCKLWNQHPDLISAGKSKGNREERRTGHHAVHKSSDFLASLCIHFYVLKSFYYIKCYCTKQ